VAVGSEAATAASSVDSVESCRDEGADSSSVVKNVVAGLVLLFVVVALALSGAGLLRCISSSSAGKAGGMSAASSYAAAGGSQVVKAERAGVDAPALPAVGPATLFGGSEKKNDTAAFESELGGECRGSEYVGAKGYTCLAYPHTREYYVTNAGADDEPSPTSGASGGDGVDSYGNITMEKYGGAGDGTAVVELPITSAAATGPATKEATASTLVRKAHYVAPTTFRGGADEPPTAYAAAVGAAKWETAAIAFGVGAWGGNAVVARPRLLSGNGALRTSTVFAAGWRLVTPAVMVVAMLGGGFQGVEAAFHRRVTGDFVGGSVMKKVRQPATALLPSTYQQPARRRASSIYDHGDCECRDMSLVTANGKPANCKDTDNSGFPWCYTFANPGCLPDGLGDLDGVSYPWVGCESESATYGSDAAANTDVDCSKPFRCQCIAATVSGFGTKQASCEAGSYGLKVPWISPANGWTTNWCFVDKECTGGKKVYGDDNKEFYMKPCHYSDTDTDARGKCCDVEIPKMSDSATYISLGFFCDAGTIPPEIGRLTKLTELLIGFNTLSGSIPPELERLTKLKKLSFAGSKIKGQ
jgi:hypothetical protein